MASEARSQTIIEEMKAALAMARRTLEYPRIDGVDGDEIRNLEAIVGR
jgi:hypothetical protein